MYVCMCVCVCFGKGEWGRTVSTIKSINVSILTISKPKEIKKVKMEKTKETNFTPWLQRVANSDFFVAGYTAPPGGVTRLVHAADSTVQLTHTKSVLTSLRNKLTEVTGSFLCFTCKVENTHTVGREVQTDRQTETVGWSVDVNVLSPTWTHQFHDETERQTHKRTEKEMRQTKRQTVPVCVSYTSPEGTLYA